MLANSTESRLLHVAVDHFGQAGLMGASTRAIAREAKTPMSSITYHFGGKIGLFRAAAACVEERMSTEIEHARISAADAVAMRDSTAARQALHDVILRIVELLFSPQTSAFAQFVVQEQFIAASSWHDGHGKVTDMVLATLAELLRCIAGTSLSEDEALLRATALYGNVLAFRFVARKDSGAAGRSETEIGMIKRIIANDLDAICDRLEGAVRPNAIMNRRPGG